MENGEIVSYVTQVVVCNDNSFLRNERLLAIVIYHFCLEYVGDL